MIPQQSISAQTEQPPDFIAKWGTQGSGDSQFNTPWGVATDSSGNVYVADRYNHRVQKFGSDGTFIAKWGTQGSGDGQFNHPHGVATDSSGNVYVTDVGNNRIQMFAPDGTFIAKWGTQGSGDGQFNHPKGVATDSSGNVYVVDSDNHRVQKFGPSGTFIAKWGGFGAGAGSLNAPWGIAADSSGNVYVADTFNHRVQKFSSDGTFLKQWGAYGNGDGQFVYPVWVATDSSNNVYVADQNNHRVQKFGSDGNFITKWGSYGNGDGYFKAPLGIAIDSSGNVYVADQNNHRVQKFGDATPPVISVPADITEEATSSTGSAVVFKATATDNVDGVLPDSALSYTVGSSPVASGDTFGLGTATVTVTATDKAGNTATNTFKVMVVDTTKPTISGMPADITKEATGPEGATITWQEQPSATDVVDGNVSVSGDHASGSVFPLGETTVTFTATDAHNNTATASFNVTVVDTTPPVLNVKDIPLEAVALSAGIPAPTFSPEDQVSPIATKSEQLIKPPTATGVGTYTYTVKATDGFGNTATKTSTFKVEYKEAFKGVQQPINRDGSSNFKLGSTAPVKFPLVLATTAPDGTPDSKPIPNAVARLRVKKASTGSGVVNEAFLTLTGSTGNEFRYDAESGQYIFNFSTKPGSVYTNPDGEQVQLESGQWTLIIALDDDTTREVNIDLRK